MKLTQLFAQQFPHTVLFDLDGTLVDSALDLTIATDQMLTALGRPPAGETRVRQWVGNGTPVLVRRALAGDHDFSHAAVDETEFTRALSLFLSIYTDINGQYATVYPGVETLLHALSDQGCRMGVVTNKPGAFTGPLLEQMGLAHWFDVSVSGDTLAVKKPAPEPLLHAMEQLGGSLATTLMVGDSVTDITAARNAGMPVVAVRYGYNFGAPIDSLGAEIVVDSLAELL
ncbi:phosphoglycolate phosphatase [Marinobacter sp. X15-166B]|uniref:phosphoglycolate phosphatase n=1 Tax=Marinobacter sp. X15-166B TaxID=1897620 RepID=UPI00085BDCAF|nr:phosphoglycolate phosphatase [Marinobacter sp. X15-166B]OEY65721.1 phosphoglycolate phosphatase [Marinobacter sp. X15-166B]